MPDAFQGLEQINTIVVSLVTAVKDVERRADQVIDKTANDIANTAKQLVPVDTGATKASIGYDRPLGADLVAIIGPTTEYAPHLEWGTARMAPRAFMGPSLDIHSPRFVKAMIQLGGDVL